MKPENHGVMDRTSQPRSVNLWIGGEAAMATLPARSIASYLIGAE